MVLLHRLRRPHIRMKTREGMWKAEAREASPLFEPNWWIVPATSLSFLSPFFFLAGAEIYLGASHGIDTCSVSTSSAILFFYFEMVLLSPPVWFIAIGYLSGPWTYDPHVSTFWVVRSASLHHWVCLDRSLPACFAPPLPHTPVPTHTSPHTQSHSHPEIVFISGSSGSKIVLGGAFVLVISYRERGVVFNLVLVGKVLLGIQLWALQALYL